MRFSFRQATAVTWKSQPASPVLFGSLRRAPGQNQEYRAHDLCDLGRIAHPPKRRGMNAHQIAFDQRLQALRITMARPGFETFSIRDS
jgi:hypothetical protein